MGKRKTKDDKLFTAYQREYERRFLKHEGKYDTAAFAFELFKEKVKMKKAFIKHDQWRDEIEYGI